MRKRANFVEYPSELIKMSRKVLVTGAGGFIGSWLVKRLKSEGCEVRGADIKEPEYEKTVADDFWEVDLRKYANAQDITYGIDDVYQLAADMGGIGYITENVSSVARNNVLINSHMLQASVENKVKRYLYTSSACVYNQSLQIDPNAAPLKEEDAYPAAPERGYGWEKLFSEQLTDYYRQDFGLDTRIVRFHNVYGSLGTWIGGREKSPAALCRKIAQANNPGVIDVWGDGKQTRTYMHISDCVEGLCRLMESGYQKPLNLGTSDVISIDNLAYLIAKIAGKNITINHVEGPQGVRGRSSDNIRIRKVLGWEPTTSLVTGLTETYKWIEEQVKKENREKIG
jgi:GDP-D-mannose 3',5'-epimerase